MTNNNPFQPPLPPGKPLKIALSFVAALGFGIGAGAVTGAVNHLPASDEVSSNIPYQAQSHTLEEYELLEIGDSLRTVEQILGKGLEQKQTDNEVEFIWKNPDGSHIQLVFKDSVLTEKEQNALTYSAKCS